MSPVLILDIFGFVFFALATAAVPSAPRFQWFPAGAACFALAAIWPAL